MFPSWFVTVENGALPTKAAVRACYLTLLTPKLPRFCLSTDYITKHFNFLLTIFLVTTEQFQQEQ